MRRALAIALAVAAAAVVALSANLVLLGYATNGNDPVGRLDPRDAVITAPHGKPRPATTQIRTVTSTPEQTTTEPTTTANPGDNHGGRGRDHPEDD